MKTLLIAFCLSLPAIVYGSTGKNGFENIPVASSLSAVIRPAEAGPDSILIFSISEVVIEQSRHSSFNEDKKLSTPDSMTMAVFSGSDAGSLLSLFTPAYINSTGGPGSSSSAFLRGTNSYQTTVNWNGFLLNSLTLGTMDLSLIPAGSVQEISVVHGAAGSIAGSGNSGGSVLLRNTADWDNRLQAGIQSELGTYGNRHLSLSGKLGNERLQFQAYMFTHRAENNFGYTDTYKPGNPAETSQNNALGNAGVIQNLFIKLPGNNKIETGIWYQARQKELPAIMGSYLPSGAVQRDSSLRVYAKWTKSWGRSSISINTALFDEQMTYKDKGPAEDGHYLVDSKIRSRRLMGDINFRYWITDYLMADGGMEVSSLSAEADALVSAANETRPAAVAAFKLRLPGVVGNVAARKEFGQDIDIPLLFSAGIRKELPWRGLAMKSSYSDQFRIPTFNDRYWQPGGNPQLLPESGHTVDIGLARETRAGGGTELNIEINAYSSKIGNMIQWVPSENGTWWRPENREEVRVLGMETSVDAEGRMGAYRYSLGLSSNFVSSVISSTQKSLMYVPSKTGSARAGFAGANAFFGFTGNYTGSRYISNDNNPLFMMPSFMVFNGYAGYSVKMGDVRGKLQLRAMNLFNARYQVVRSYPMPGRTFHLSFSVQFNNQ